LGTVFRVLTLLYWWNKIYISRIQGYS